jgi:hypothetical protein
MTEAITIALISNVTTIIVVVFCRIWSNREHRENQAVVTDTNDKVSSLVNGKY